MDDMKSYFLGDRTYYEKDGEIYTSNRNNRCTFDNILLYFYEESNYFMQC